MRAVVRRATLLGLLVLSVACSDPPLPSAPTPVPSPVVPAPPPPAVTIPPFEGPAHLYAFSHSLEYPVQAYTTNSTYLLYENGAFALQYSTVGRPYAGEYQREENRILFRFAGDHRWSAVGTIDGDSLEVRYNDIMMHSDFENAVYTRAQ
jgi:hypothetical protein